MSWERGPRFPFLQIWGEGIEGEMEDNSTFEIWAEKEKSQGYKELRKRVVKEDKRRWWLWSDVEVVEELLPWREGPAGMWGWGGQKWELEKQRSEFIKPPPSAVHPSIPNKVPTPRLPPPSTPPALLLLLLSISQIPYRAGPDGIGQSGSTPRHQTFSHHSLHSSEGGRQREGKGRGMGRWLNWWVFPPC